VAFVLGHLEPVEDSHFREHVLQGCVECARELRESRTALAHVDLELAQADLARTPAPSARLRQRLIDSVRRGRAGAPPVPAPSHAPRAWQHWREDCVHESERLAGGLLTVEAARAAWQTTAFQGVCVRPLSVDARRRSVSMLVRMDPGSSYPGHTHAGREECLVLSGELEVAGRTLRAGDYQLADEGSHHGLQSSPSGCTLFIVSSQDDRLD
jgi:quercetin dioxygenase-like cupin family protein